MSFYKPYKNRKDHRQPHRGAKSFDSSCQNHHSCPWCRSNRTIRDQKNNERAKTDLREGR